MFAFHIDPRNDPTIDPMKRAAPLMGHHLGDLKSITHQGLQSLNRQVDVLHQQNETLCAAMSRQVQLSQHMCNAIGSAVNAAHAAHTQSPVVALPNIAPLTSPTIPPAGETGVVTTPHSPTRQTATAAAATADTPNSVFPEFDRLSYESIEQTYDDWFGDNESLYAPHGGIKQLYDNKQWRKSLGCDASKREADKKMLQKMKRIGEYMENYINNGKTKEQMAFHLRELLSNSPKNKETLTGIDKLLKDEAKNT